MRMGIDIGSYYIKAALLDSSGNMVDHRFCSHNGEPLKVVREFQESFQQPLSAMGVTGSLAGLISGDNGHLVDEIQAMIRGSFHLSGYSNNILYLGASSISLLKVNKEGELLDFRSNSVCAAGTGSFLDQQAERMGITTSEVSHFEGMDNPPSIAARCAVFAKSDLIHRQQEGYTIPQLWCGLCRGLSFTIANTLLSGEVLTGRSAVIGGVALNQEVVNWLGRKTGGDLHVVENPHLAPAIGAAMLATPVKNQGDSVTRVMTLSGTSSPSHNCRPPLVLKRSQPAVGKAHWERVDDDENEIRLIEPIQGTIDVSLGMDIGSTSTKIAVLDRDNRVLLDIYRRTSGDPLGAMRKILRAIHVVLQETGAAFNVTACGTTGSGRKLIGQVLGADRIVNEITAHASGAVLLFGEDIETIFEIGGQDSKYMHMQRGRIDNVNMNYVCAAGTGSFVEEQANKLGMDLTAIGDAVLGLTPPLTSERCTVFMERDVEKLLRDGFSREESMAAVLYSVCFNYLTKVVGTRPVTGQRILFQGATARNKGLVAAFEIIMDKEILTSSFCHVAGAIGAACLASEQVASSPGKTSFRGLDLFQRKTKVHYTECDYCVNHCKITHAIIEGESSQPSWGYMCGREPEETTRTANTKFECFENRRTMFMKAGKARSKKREALEVTLPRALGTYAYLPLWRAFFGQLGVTMKVTPATNRKMVEDGISSSTADFCFPVKVFLGHVAQALDGGGQVFVPHYIAGEKTRITTKSVLCPYVQSGPSIALSSEVLAEDLRERLINPVIDFSYPDWMNVRELHASLKPFGISRNRISKAWKDGVSVLRDYREACLREGERVLAEVEESGEKALLVVGRYYNVYDGGINLGIPEKLSELGLRVIPYEFLPFSEDGVDEFFQNMFWYYGQRILSAAKFARNRKNLFLVYLTNFSCGPDSFVLSYVEEMMGRKPTLILELDEHSADTGYSTRLEAFADVVARYEQGSQEKEKDYLYVKNPANDFAKKRVLIPPMHQAVVPMFSAAFEKHGYECMPLPEITPEQFELGRKHTRGSECLPAHITTGNILYALEKYNLKADEVAIFMPTSDGPCRFGQYATLQRIVLNKFGYDDVALISPSAQNAYMGLSSDLRRDLWKAVLVGDIIFKMFCRVAPYEDRAGETVQTFETVLEEAMGAFKAGADYTQVIRDSERVFSAVSRTDESKPLVGIVGEIFVRCNPFSSDKVIDWILAADGEPWLAPISEWILYTAYFHRYESIKKMSPVDIFKSYLNDIFLTRMEHEAYRAAGDLLAGRHEPAMADMMERGKKYFPVEFTAEAILTVGRALMFIEKDRADMIVNASPFTCMPGAITGGILRQISTQRGIPIVSMFYDGTVGMNERISSFLRNLEYRMHGREGSAPVRQV